MEVSLPVEEEVFTTNRTFLEELNVKNCPKQVSHCTPSNGTNVTDLLIWDEKLSSDEMLSWTKCR